MSYPPARHLLRDLGFAGTGTREESINRITITDGLLGPIGVRLGVLATLVDVSGAGIALSSVAPGWIATADLNVHLVQPVFEGAVSAICRPLRVGARSVVVRADLTDEGGNLIAIGRMAFARIPGSATQAVVEEAVSDGLTSFAMEGGRPLLEPLTERCGMESVGPGQLRFEKSEYVRNSFGTVNGGVLALAADEAAVSAAGGGSATDLQIHYLEQIGDGPVGVTAEVIRGDKFGAQCTVRIEDRSTGRLAAISDVRVETRPTS